jgi:tRNA-2-methylthio-N6-dimethylallyladenosine synthase
MEVIRKVQNADRDIAISTDLIVGYPGETERDFEDTLSLLDEVQYDSAFSFKYSPRPNTAALELPDDVPEEEKGRRLEVLQQRQKDIQYKRNARYVRRAMDVLVEDEARSRFRLMGRTENNKIVNFDGPENLLGTIVRVEITGFSPNSLKGVLVNAERFEESGAA